MSAAILRIRVKGALAAPPRQLLLPPVPVRKAGRRELLAVLAVFVALALVAGGSMLVPQRPLGDELLSVQDEPKPPEPAKPQPKPPEPPPPPEAPKDETPPPTDPNPPPQASPDPPPPQFGFPDGATADNGSFAVATGSTVMKPAEAVVKAAPVAPPPPPQATPTALTRAPDELAPLVPEYPNWAEEQGVTAVVVAQVVIDASGAVTEVNIVRSGGKDFDRAARAALAGAKYHPYIKDGKAVPAVFERRIEFRLD